MTNHPNRSKKSPSPARNPTKEEVKAARASAGLTQPEAAKLVHRTTSAWARWEGGDRKMPADTWELFQIKINSPEEKEK